MEFNIGTAITIFSTLFIVWFTDFLSKGSQRENELKRQRHEHLVKLCANVQLMIEWNSYLFESLVRMQGLKATLNFWINKEHFDITRENFSSQQKIFLNARDKYSIAKSEAISSLIHFDLYFDNIPEYKQTKDLLFNFAYNPEERYTGLSWEQVQEMVKKDDAYIMEMRPQNKQVEYANSLELFLKKNINVWEEIYPEFVK